MLRSFPRFRNHCINCYLFYLFSSSETLWLHHEYTAPTYFFFIIPEELEGWFGPPKYTILKHQLYVVLVLASITYFFVFEVLQRIWKGNLSMLDHNRISERLKNCVYFKYRYYYFWVTSLSISPPERKKKIPAVFWFAELIFGRSI